MPKLITFVPCAKVIIDQDDNTVSLVSVLESIKIFIPESEDSSLPENAVVPFNWCVYALWHKESGESEKYEERVELKLPDGRMAFQSIMPFEMTPYHRHRRTTVNIKGFPILPDGEYAIKLFLRKAGEENPWEEVAQYPIYVQRPV
jgi:hypothetical protein